MNGYLCPFYDIINTPSMGTIIKHEPVFYMYSSNVLEVLQIVG